MSDGADDEGRERMPHPSERDPEADVNRWPGRARRVGTDREGDGIDREPTRSRSRSEWEADGGRSQDRDRGRGGSPFRRRGEDDE